MCLFTSFFQLVCKCFCLLAVSGEAHLKLNQYEEAERWYREALKAKPDHVPAHLTMANLKHKQVTCPSTGVWSS